MSIKKLNETHPQIADFLLNKSESCMLSHGSHTKTYWICPNCGNIIYYSVSKVCTYGYVPCKRCSDKISYPNKFMFCMLEQIGVDFETEYSPDWIKPKKYDFYIRSKNIIIEMDGALGHGNVNRMNGDDGTTSALIDQYKDEMAYKNGIKVIRVDCFISDCEYIVNSIMNTELSTIFDLNMVDFILCHKNAISSYKMKVCNEWNKTHNVCIIEEKYKLSRNTICKWLKECAKYGFCDYETIKQQIISGEKNIKKAQKACRKPVLCLETNTVFESCREAYKWLGYNIDGHSIQDNCKGITNSAGRHPTTKEKLHWKFASTALA